MSEETKAETLPVPLFDDAAQGAGLPEGVGNEDAKILKTNDDVIAEIEKAAELAPRMEDAIRKIMIAVAYPEDWIDHEGKACLASAGAERFLKHFPIRFSSWTAKREDWTDEIGPAYRWIYRAVAQLWGRQIACQGTYSTREPLHGKTSAGWRDLKDIDEADIMAAAMHICQGAGIKQILGLRGIPTKYLVEKIGITIKSVKYDKGGQGGISDDERDKQNRISEMLREVFADDKKAMTEALEQSTAFTVGSGDDKGKEVPGVKDVRRLKGKRLDITYGAIEKKFKEWQKGQG